MAPTVLRIVKDGSSSLIYARRIAVDSYGVYAQTGVAYSSTVPDDTHVAIIGAGTSFVISSSPFTPPTSSGTILQSNVSVNIGSIWVKDIDTLYFSTVADGLINIEYYKILGGVEY